MVLVINNYQDYFFKRMGVVGMSQDGEFGIMNRITSLYRVSPFVITLN